MRALERGAVADIGDVPMHSRFSLESCHADIESHFGAIRAAGVRTLAVGGDHSISLSILKALGTRPAGRHDPYRRPLRHRRASSRARSSTTAGRSGRPCSTGVLDPERTIQIGIRGAAEYLWEFSYDSGMTVIHAEEIDRLGIPAVIERARRVIGDGPAYLTFDVDSLDPAFAPGTGTPEIGGLTTREALELLRGLVGLDIVGGDVVEVAPQYDATTNTAHAAAQVMFAILCLMVRAPSFERRPEHDRLLSCSASSQALPALGGRRGGRSPGRRQAQAASRRPG